MSNLSKLLKPKRQHGETYEAYCARRKEGHVAIKEFLKGRFIWIANKLAPVEVNHEGMLILSGTSTENDVVVETRYFKKQVDGNYDHAKHGVIGTPRHKPMSRGRLHKYQFGYGR